MPPSPALSLVSLGRRFGRRWALAGVTLAAEAGQTIAILGENGSGKTTLVQLVTGLIAPTEGRVEIMGQDMARAPAAALRHVGVVFQEQTLDLELSADANLALHGDLQGLPRREAAARGEALLARFDLIERRGDPARTLSGGNRRRLEICRALLHGPAILVLDEPTVGLDPPARAGLMREVRALGERGVLVLWTTHLLEEARAADRILVLSRGRIAQDGPAAGIDLGDLGGG